MIINIKEIIKKNRKMKEIQINRFPALNLCYFSCFASLPGNGITGSVK